MKIRTSAGLPVAFVCLLLVLGWPGSGMAQDSHYWTNQFGIRSSFMGGAVVGGVRDPSAGFYNPGALAFIDRPSLSINVDALRFSDIHINNGVGGAADLDSEEAEVIPLLVAGLFNPKKLSRSNRHVLGYTLLSRNNSLVTASARRESVEEVLTNPTAPGPETFIGQFTRKDTMLEAWGGISYAYRLSDRWGVGITNFLALRQQSSNQVILARAINQGNGATGTMDNLSNFDYWNFRLLWKLGAAADYDRWKFGVSVTTPSLNIGGDGTVGADLTVTNVDFNGDGIPETFVGDDRQESLSTDYRSPFSVALGAEYQIFEQTRVAVTVEWFDKKSRYAVILPEDKSFVLSPGGFAANSRNLLQVTDAGDDEINYAIGVEHAFSEKFVGYFSFRSDKDYLPEFVEEGLPLGFANWDIYHTTVGLIRRGAETDIGMGVVYSRGETDRFPQFVNFAGPTEEGFLEGEPGPVSIDYQAITLLLGFNHYF